MTTLLYAEHDNKTLSVQTAKALDAALAIGDDVDIVVCGHHTRAVCQQAAKLHNIRQVIAVDAESLEHQLAEPTAEVLLTLADNYDFFVAAATTTGKNLMPRLAARLNVMQISDIIEIVAPDTFKRPIYAGNAIATVQSTDAKKVITVRTTAFKARTADKTTDAIANQDAPIQTMAASAISALSSAAPTQFVAQTLSDNEHPDLTSARVVISGGRGLGSQQQFMSLLVPLANKLNAAIGASRAAVDAGYAPNDWQVGQTGKVVAPELYIAVGVSGAIQHLAGMKESRIIVAINQDAEAPIMQVADYTLLGDLFQLVPELEKALPA